MHYFSLPAPSLCITANAEYNNNRNGNIDLSNIQNCGIYVHCAIGSCAAAVSVRSRPRTLKIFGKSIVPAVVAVPTFSRLGGVCMYVRAFERASMCAERQALEAGYGVNDVLQMYWLDTLINN